MLPYKDLLSMVGDMEMNLFNSQGLYQIMIVVMYLVTSIFNWPKTVNPYLALQFTKMCT